MPHKVSICIPAYGQPALLSRALQSVATQSFDDFEVVVTDDSPDDSVQRAVEPFRSSFPVNYSRNSPAKGAPANWNRGLELAGGAYVKPLHHDDWFAEPDSLARFVDMLDQNPKAVLAFSGATHVNPQGRTTGGHRASGEQISGLGSGPAILFGNNFVGAPSAVIFRRTETRFDERLKWFVDLDFYMRLLLDRDTGFAWTDDALVNLLDASPDRVTAACKGNPNVEVYEWCRVYGKLVQSGLSGRTERQRLFGALWDFGITSAGELQKYGVEEKNSRRIGRGLWVYRNRKRLIAAFRHFFGPKMFRASGENRSKLRTTEALDAGGGRR